MTGSPSLSMRHHLLRRAGHEFIANGDLNQNRAVFLLGLIGAVLLVGGALLWSQTEAATAEVPVIGVGCSLVMGLLVTRRQPSNRVGLLLVALGIAGSAQFWLEAHWWVNAARLDTPPATAIWAFRMLGAAGTIAFSGNLVFLPLVFPNGRTHATWAKWVLLASFVIVSAQAGSMLLSGHDLCVEEAEFSDQCLRLIEDPQGISWLPSAAEPPLDNLFGPLIVVSTIGALAAAVSRFRGSTGETRLQMKWFALAALSTGLTVPPVIVLNSTLGLEYPGWIFNIPFVLMPLCVAIAVLRFRLYEIDRIISRTVSYAIVVGLLVGGVVSVATLVSTRFDSPLVVAATTLGVAAVFNPLRWRVQRVVDRRFNRSRYDVEQVLLSFAGTLRDRVDADRLIDGWVDVVSETMQPSQVFYWVRE